MRSQYASFIIQIIKHILIIQQILGFVNIWVSLTPLFESVCKKAKPALRSRSAGKYAMIQERSLARKSENASVMTSSKVGCGRMARSI